MSNRVYRTDQGRVVSMERTPAGALRVRATLTRVGVLEYRDARGRVTSRELRPPEEVFSDHHLDSLRGACVTDGHPPERYVDSSTWRTHSRGHVGDDVRRVGDGVEATLTIADADLADEVEGRRRHDVSEGYACRIERTPGVWRGEKYDAVQRDIRANHVGVGGLGWGRAGAGVCLHIDAKEPYMSHRLAIPRIEFDRATRTIHVDGTSYDAVSQKEQALAAVRAGVRHLRVDEIAPEDLAARLDEMAGTISGLLDQVVGLQSMLAGADAEAAEAAAAAPTEEQMAAAAADMADQMAEARMTADSICPGVEIPRGSTPAAIRRLALCGAGVDVEGRSDDYVAGAFEARARVAASPAAASVAPADVRAMASVAGSDGTSIDPRTDPIAGAWRRQGGRA